MRVSGPWLPVVCGLVLAAVPVQGQVRMGISLPRRSFLVGESVAANLVIESQTPLPLVLGPEHHNAELMLELVSTRQGPGGQPERRQVQRDAVVMPGTQMRDVVEITSLYNFLAPGNYRVTAVLFHEGSSFRSVPFAFDVVRGIEMKSLRQMLPGYSDVELIYSFRYASRDGQEQAFLVIESADGTALYGTFVLGSLLRLYQPLIRARVDGTVVVVHQSGRNRFSRSVIRVDRGGAEFVEQRHFRSDGRPIEPRQ